MSEPNIPKRFQFQLRTLIVVSLWAGLVMLLNLKPTPAYQILVGDGTKVSITEQLDWYGWPMPAFWLTTYPWAVPEHSHEYSWETVAIWIDSITAALILYLAARIGLRRREARKP